MANIKISELTALTPPAAADELVVVDVSATSTKKTTVGEVVGIITGDVEVASNGTATISELPVSKLQDGTARQVLQTDAAGTGVEWASNIDIPGTLDVTGAATFDAAVSVPLGSAAAPTLTFTGDTNTGIYSPGADQVAISTGGSERLAVGASGNITIPSGGNLGINGAAPQSPLDVISNSSGYGISMRGRSGDNLSQFRFASNNFAATYAALDSAPTYLAAQVNGSERLRITSAGLVGVGTSSPVEKLDVTGNYRGRGGTSSANTIFTELNFVNTDTTASPGVRIAAVTGGNTSRHELAFYTTSNNGTNTTEKVRIDHAGNVGIGTTSPGQPLHVAGNARITGEVYADTALLVGAGGEQKLLASGGTSGFTSLVAQRWNGSAYAETARIDSSGRLLVGASSDSGGALLQVNGNRIRIATAKTPSSAADTGTAGEICWDANYIYVCTATDTWKRTAISTW